MILRPATLEDRRALGRIAFETGYFGASAARFFPDRTLLTELWVGPYLDEVGCCNTVAAAEGKVLGYIIGTCDVAAYRRHFVRRVPRLAAQLSRGDFPHWRGCLPYLLRMARYPSKTAPLTDFPAQLHINVSAGTRGQGVGGRLLRRYLECLRTRGVAGVQLSTTRENAAALSLYEKYGFEVWLEVESPLWRPWLGHNAVHVVMTKRL